MSNLLTKGIAWLDDQRIDHLSDIVVYMREGEPPLSIAATQGQTIRDVLDESGQTIESNSVDWLVSTASLKWGGVPTSPKIGDQIQIVEEGGSVKTFEVLDLNGQGHYRWADSRGRITRIHTKLRESINV